ncbi:MAG: hypothetical protein GQ527_01670, partial [Bacteroidales bacterium]|nr:hypothetical protein [Bacteroidales bacterium]
EHRLRNYTGGTGKAIADGIGGMMSLIDTEESMSVDQMPIINAFVREYPERNWKLQGKFYEYKDEVQAVKSILSENKKNAKEGIVEERIPHPDKYRMMEQVLKSADGRINRSVYDLDNGSIDLNEYFKQVSDIQLEAIHDIDHQLEELKQVKK